MAFMKYMGRFHEGKGSWTSEVGIQEHIESAESSDVLFVDVGGNMGTQASEFRQAAGDIPGRVIVQDLAETVAIAPQIAGVEMTVHDFFTPQTVKGAKYYFLRNVLHDYPDQQCLEILSNLLSVFNKDSVLIINELVLPDTGASILQTQQDLSMLITQAAMERTEKEWRTLLEKAGLRILRIVTYSPFEGDSVIEAVPTN